MNLTDLMICGFDGERVVFSANVTTDDYTVVITACDELHLPSTPSPSSPRFAALLRIACDLNATSPRMEDAATPDQRD